MLTSPWAASLVLGIFYFVLLAGVAEKSATFDEPGHAVAGYTYWKFGDYRIDPENGVLSKRWLALPLLWRETRFPTAPSPGWTQSNSWLLSDEWFHRLGNDSHSLLARGRAMSGVVAIALGALVWWWARRLFGPAGGMVGLLLYAFNPAILANGALMTSDLPAALGFLAALAGVSLVLERITRLRVALGAGAIAGLFLAKMSAALLLPMAALLAIARIADGRPLVIGEKWTLRRRSHQALAFAAVALGQTVAVVALVWAAYGFRYSAFSPRAPEPHVFHDPWEWEFDLPPPRAMLGKLHLDAGQQRAADAILPPNSGEDARWTNRSFLLVGEIRRRVLRPEQDTELGNLLRAPPAAAVPRLIHFLREHRLLPEAFLYGYAHAWKTSGVRAGFLNGDVRNTGWWYFFPYTFAVKTPLALFALAALALAVAVVRLRARASANRETAGRACWALAYPVLPLAVLFIVYWAFALTSNLNIGHRHLLPIYAPLCILAAGAIRWWQPRSSSSTQTPAGWPRFKAPVLLGVLLLECAWWFPNYLAYFNGLVRPSTAYQHLIDSSLDWGQELPAIARYLRAHPNEAPHLAYFGVDSPAAHGIKARLVGGFPNFDGKYSPPMKLLTSQSPAELAAFYHDHPAYDPELVMRVDGPVPSALAVQRGAALRLEPGLYVISASMFAPLYNGNVNGFWTAETEATYQRLKRTVAPFFSDDRNAKLAALPAHPIFDWQQIWDDYFDFRLARINAFLRRRQPDDLINWSVLVYRLSAADLAQALEGPPPLER